MMFVGMPPEHLEGARQQPMWPMREAVAHTLPCAPKHRPARSAFQLCACVLRAYNRAASEAASAMLCFLQIDRL